MKIWIDNESGTKSDANLLAIGNKVIENLDICSAMTRLCGTSNELFVPIMDRFS